MKSNVANNEMHATSTETRETKQRISRSSSISQTSLLDLARMQRWSEVEERVALSRREAKHRDADGLLPLHWACSGGPPVSVVDKLLKAYRKGARRVDSDGSTPLHFAAHYGASKLVVEQLLQANGEAVNAKDKYGRTPLYHAVTKQASYDVIRVLTKANPQMAITPCLSSSSSSSKQLRAVGKQSILGHYKKTPLHAAWYHFCHSGSRPNKGRLWEKAMLLLRAAYLGYVADEQQQQQQQGGHQVTQNRKTFQIVHAAVAFDSFLPQDLLPLLLKEYPQQVHQADDVGRLPLAIAASLTLVNRERSHDLIKILLDVYPDAAGIADSSGRTPLVLALASGKRWSWGVERLFWACPQRVHMRDLLTGLYPFMLAAAATASPQDEENDNDTTTTLGEEEESIESSTSQRRRDNKAIDLQRQIMMQPSCINVTDSSQGGKDAAQVSTVFELLQANPAVLGHAVN